MIISNVPCLQDKTITFETDLLLSTADLAAALKSSTNLMGMPKADDSTLQMLQQEPALGNASMQRATDYEMYVCHTGCLKVRNIWT